MSSVYKASLNGMICCVKEFDTEQLDADGKRLLREVIALAESIQHPHVVQHLGCAACQCDAAQRTNRLQT